MQSPFVVDCGTVLFPTDKGMKSSYLIHEIKTQMQFVTKLPSLKMNNTGLI